ncbi:MAG: SIR2 family protein [Candidatus Nitrohelix vancouverensis]|uniref:SIR2 family protein n=1 Tax=Candidatus Nitrohelix vancouverensis TaxID=2705534 RepID=A0A7T0G2F4_9BACT|nr:MAG: SIR2 family protein [Candidatus Nitrohelix vancouverensis]
MSPFFEIAYAAVSNSLCLFTGTGFSKAISENEAPSWKGLLESMCDLTDKPEELKAGLFPNGEVNSLSLEEAAQVISIELEKNGKSIHEEIAALIKTIKLKGDNSSIAKFLTAWPFTVISTNYDKLIETLSGEGDCYSLSPGLPIPRSEARVKVYHVHGSVDSPVNMVVTSNDYFQFINSESYFSKKLSTILHENCVVILGYSLGDNNLKSILSNYKGFSKNHVISSNIIFISRTAINKHVKDYYSHCYGIRVMDEISVHQFFEKLEATLDSARSKVEPSISNIKKVIIENKIYSESYVRNENSFYEIILSIAAIGKSIDDKSIVAALGKVIEMKIKLTCENHAWDQYTHLAEWLIYLANILELKGTTIESIYLNATLKSMNSMSQETYVGYSWQAYKSWSEKWLGIIASNRILIRNYVEKNSTSPDALLLVKRN